MKFPVAIDFHGIAAPAVLRDEVLDRVRHLERIIDDILACRVLVEADARERPSGDAYCAYVRVTMPCIEIEAGARPIPDPYRQDPHLTVEETFDILTRRIEHFARERCASCTRYAAARRRR